MNSTELIYLDYNATTPIDPEVAEAMEPFLNEHFGNPSSAYAIGKMAAQAVAAARAQVAESIGALPEEIVFTSGGSESNNHALKGAAFKLREQGNHIITSTIEHPAVTEVCRFLEGQGYRVSWIEVDQQGLIDLDELEREICSETILISVMHANNEIGTIQPVEEISQIVRKREIVLHTDAAQSLGKISTMVGDLGVDLLTIAGHKVYAPKGIGALYVKDGIELEKFIHGAGQEAGARAGTENVLEIVGLGKACELAKRNLVANAMQMAERRAQLLAGLLEIRKDLQLNGHPDNGLPNTLNVSFPRIGSAALLEKISDRLAVSAGAACHSGEQQISAVLQAMKLPEEQSRGALRFSTGRNLTKEHVDQALIILADALAS